MAETKVKKKDEESTEPKAGGTELATTSNESTDLVATDDDFFAEGGGGLSDFQQSDFLIPYVRIIQALSKELQRNHAKFIQGAAQGMFVNSATRKLYDGEKTGILAVPVGFGHRYMAWRPNNAGPAYDMGDDATKFNSIEPNDEGKRIDSEGNELTDALQFFTLLVNPETFEWEVAVLNFSGVQAKKGRGWATTINNRMERFPVGHPKAGQLFRPNIWFYAYKITTVPESNDKGSWYGFSIEEGPKVKDLTNGREIYQAASELRKRIDANEVKAAIERDDDDQPGEEKAF
jgi:hypothetical protein